MLLLALYSYKKIEIKISIPVQKWQNSQFKLSVLLKDFFRIEK